MKNSSASTSPTGMPERPKHSCGQRTRSPGRTNVEGTGGAWSSTSLSSESKLSQREGRESHHTEGTRPHFSGLVPLARPNLATCSLFVAPGNADSPVTGTSQSPGVDDRDGFRAHISQQLMRVALGLMVGDTSVPAFATLSAPSNARIVGEILVAACWRPWKTDHRRSEN